MGFNLLKGIQGYPYHYQKPGAAEVKLHAYPAHHKIRKHCYHGEECGSGQSYASQNPIDIFAGSLPRPYSRNETPIFSHIIRQIHRVEDYGCIKVCKKYDQKSKDERI